ncbi:hypothetical protein KIW84_044575 [Lathyrus oleraceus]|uniref:Uncharacterized protein n=1 Tax=Pisum sativum TaxID=3888 RepID=A0A9D4XI28_PEA|nr:hypothetical protein KIW84_044575 [Pisum sativum]
MAQSQEQAQKIQQPTQLEKQQAQQQEQIREGIRELTLSTPVIQLEVLCELLVDFENLKVNGFDLTKGVRTQGWKGYFGRFKGPVYRHKISISEKAIAKLLNPDGSGKRCFDMLAKKAQRRFSDKLSEFLDPLVELFSPRTPIRALPSPEIVVSKSITSEIEVDDMVIPPPISDIAIVYGIKPIMDVEDSSSEHIPLVLQSLQELENENRVVRSRLDKQYEMFKEQARE